MTSQPYSLELYDMGVTRDQLIAAILHENNLTPQEAPQLKVDTPDEPPSILELELDSLTITDDVLYKKLANITICLEGYLQFIHVQLGHILYLNLTRAKNSRNIPEILPQTFNIFEQETMVQFQLPRIDDFTSWPSPLIDTEVARDIQIALQHVTGRFYTVITDKLSPNFSLSPIQRLVVHLTEHLKTLDEHKQLSKSFVEKYPNKVSELVGIVTAVLLSDQAILSNIVFDLLDPATPQTDITSAVDNVKERLKILLANDRKLWEYFEVSRILTGLSVTKLAESLDLDKVFAEELDAEIIAILKILQGMYDCAKLLANDPALHKQKDDHFIAWFLKSGITNFSAPDSHSDPTNT